MRYLVLTDIHANLEALDVCLADARDRGFDETLVLGAPSVLDRLLARPLPPAWATLLAEVTTTTGGENANLTFAGTAGNRVAMRISGVSMSPKPNTGIKVSIQKPDGTTLVSPFDVGSSGTWMEPVATPVTGTYKIVLDGQSTYKGKATVTLWTVPADPTTFPRTERATEPRRARPCQTTASR